MKNSQTIRPKTTPALEALKTHRVFGDKVLAVQTAKNLFKSDPTIKVYLSLTGKFIVSNQEHNLDEVDFRGVSMQSIRNEDEISELYDSRWILKQLKGKND